MYQAEAPHEPEMYVDGLPSSWIEARALKDGISFDEARNKLLVEYHVKAEIEEGEK